LAIDGVMVPASTSLKISVRAFVNAAPDLT